MADRWVCDICSRELESDIEPANCPCGSHKVQRIEKKSRLEKFIERLFRKKNGGE